MAHLPPFLKLGAKGPQTSCYNEKSKSPSSKGFSSPPPPQAVSTLHLSLAPSLWSGQGSDAGIRTQRAEPGEWGWGVGQNARSDVCGRECTCVCPTAGIWEVSRTWLCRPSAAGRLPGYQGNWDQRLQWDCADGSQSSSAGGPQSRTGEQVQGLIISCQKHTSLSLPLPLILLTSSLIMPPPCMAPSPNFIRLYSSHFSAGILDCLL